MSFTNEQLIIGGLGAAVVGYWITRKGLAAIDPTSTDNVVYSGVNAVGDVLNDGEAAGVFCLGAWFYDVTRLE